MKDRLMKSLEFSDIFECIENFPKQIENDKELLKAIEIPKYRIKNVYINHKRREKRELVEEELEKMYNMKEEFKGTYQRLKFLNKFYLYSELTK
jgi:hypothetical protein